MKFSTFRIDIGLVAGGYEGVDHGSAICGVVIVAVAIVVQAYLQWAYDVSSNFVSADSRKMRTDSFQKSRTTRFRKIRVVR